MKMPLIALLVFPLALSAADGQILSYNFNAGTGTTTSSSTANTNVLTFTSTTGVATDYYSANNAGVSGLAGDYAYANVASGMGSAAAPNGGGVALSSSAAATLNNLTSFTIVGWYNTESATGIGNTANLINAGANAFSLFSNTAGQLQLVVGTGGPNQPSQTSSIYSETNKWVFFAVTYDSTLTSNNVTYYAGDSTTTAAVSGLIRTLNQGTTGSSSPLAIGNTDVANNYSRPFQGDLDDIAIYGSTAGSSGALSLSQIQAIQTDNLLNVPEPSSLALSALGVLGLFLVRRRVRGV